jgi:hypothetical protein
MQGGRGYDEIVQGIAPLGREEDPKGGESKALYGSASSIPTTSTPSTPSSPISSEEKDKLITRTDVRRIREMNRRRKELYFKQSGANWDPWASDVSSAPNSNSNSNSSSTASVNASSQKFVPTFKENPICERVWAAALHNTGEIEMVCLALTGVYLLSLLSTME